MAAALIYLSLLAFGKLGNVTWWERHANDRTGQDGEPKLNSIRISWLAGEHSKSYHVLSEETTLQYWNYTSLFITSILTFWSTYSTQLNWEMSLTESCTLLYLAIWNMQDRKKNPPHVLPPKERKSVCTVHQPGDPRQEMMLQSSEAVPCPRWSHPTTSWFVHSMWLSQSSTYSITLRSFSSL